MNELEFLMSIATFYLCLLSMQPIYILHKCVDLY